MQYGDGKHTQSQLHNMRIPIRRPLRGPKEYATHHGEFCPTPFKIWECVSTELEPPHEHEKAPLTSLFPK